MLANWPVTLIVIMPTNNRLMATKTGTSESRGLILSGGTPCEGRGAIGDALVSCPLSPPPCLLGARFGTSRDSDAGAVEQHGKVWSGARMCIAAQSLRPPN